LIEAQARRAAFLRLAARELGLTVEIHHARAEDAGHGPLRESAGAATARALATLPVGLELTLPFVALGGRAVLMSGDPGRDASLGPPVTLAAAAAALGGGPPRWSQFEVPGAKERRWVMIVQKIGSTPQRFPRHAGAIRRRPLDDGVA
jgi:16S rRNA (guanine527-N7)-methyltransferase